MTGWLLGIAGIVVIGVVVELLLTDSAMSKFIRSIYAFFLLLVIVSPLPGFFSSGIEVGGDLQYDWVLIGNLNTASAKAAENRLVRNLETAGISGVLVTVKHDSESPSFRIESVYINAWNAELREDRQNINVRTEVIRIAIITLNIREEQIMIVVK